MESRLLLSYLVDCWAWVEVVALYLGDIVWRWLAVEWPCQRLLVGHCWDHHSNALSHKARQFVCGGGRRGEFIINGDQRGIIYDV